MDYKQTALLRSYLSNEFTHQTPVSPYWFNWCFFFTITTKEIPLTEKQALRLMNRFCANVQYGERLGNGALKVFWILERFKRREGYHIHGLISLPELNRLNSSLGVRTFDDYWQKSTGLKVERMSNGDRLYYDSSGATNKHRVEFKWIKRHPERVKRSIIYTTKYLFKENDSQWFLDVSGPDYDLKYIKTDNMQPSDKKYARELSNALRKEKAAEDLSRYEKYLILQKERKHFFAHARQSASSAFLVGEALPKLNLKELNQGENRLLGEDNFITSDRICPHFNDYPKSLCGICGKK